MPLRIEDYGVIGDCETAALVGRDGSIDWLCWPRFDSDACFAALLGDPSHGRWQIKALGETVRITRSYRKDALIIQQRLHQEKALVDSEKKAAEAEVTKDRDILAELQRQREMLVQTVDSGVLNTYRQIGKVRKGVALARATQDSCQACHVRIRPHVVSQVMAGEQIVTCDSCQRILYWKPDAPYEATS